jgi:hypothetical protein
MRENGWSARDVKPPSSAAQLDIWSISTKARAAPDGTAIEAGVPFHESADLER